MGDQNDSGFFGKINGVNRDFSLQNDGRFYRDNSIMAATMQKDREEKRNTMRVRREERERQRLEAELNEIAKLKTKLARKNKEKVRAYLRQVNYNALRIQSAWRAHTAEGMAQERRVQKAALILQMFARICLARKRRRILSQNKEAEDRKLKEYAAAVKIQQLARIRVSNQKIHLRRTKCAMKIQIVVRQFLSSKRAERMHAEMEKGRERARTMHLQYNHSAKVIQTSARSRSARSILKTKREENAGICAAVKLQQMFRVVAASKRVQQVRQLVALEKIQSDALSTAILRAKEMANGDQKKIKRW